MLSNEIFNAMEILSKSDLINMCKKMKINTKIQTYDPNGNIVSTKYDYCTYDLIKLLKSYFVNKDNIAKIIYYDYYTPNLSSPRPRRNQGLPINMSTSISPADRIATLSAKRTNPSHLDNVTNRNDEFIENSLITFRNVKQIQSKIKKLYKKYYKTNFEYDKISYNILSNKWAYGELVTVKQFMDEHFYSKKYPVSNYQTNSDVYDKTKKQIISSINEFTSIKYNKILL